MKKKNDYIRNCRIESAWSELMSRESYSDMNREIIELQDKIIAESSEEVRAMFLDFCEMRNKQNMTLLDKVYQARLAEGNGNWMTSNYRKD